MKTKDLLAIGTAALGTATLTVVFLASPRMTGTDTDPTAATIAKPKLAANGIEVTLSAANGRVFKAGDQPEFVLQAVNTRNEPAEAAICATLYVEQVRNPMSRTPSMPSVLWHQDLELALKPNETKTLTLAARTNLPANSSITVNLSQVVPDGAATAAGNPGNLPAAPLMPRGAAAIVAMRFSTVPPAATPANTVAAAGGVAMVPSPR